MCLINDQCSKTGPIRHGWCTKHYKNWYKYGDPLAHAPSQAIPDLPGEEWRPVVDWEGLYAVSNLGRLQSLFRLGHPGRLLKPFPSGQEGYLAVKLCRDGKGTTAYVHQIVARAFIGECQPGQQVRHGPGRKLDNRAINLCYGTPPEDAQDKVRDQSAPRGEKHYRAKLTWQIADEIRQRFAAGTPQKALAYEYGVSQPSISMIVTGKTWRHY